MGNPNTSEPTDGCPLEGRLHASKIKFYKSKLFHYSPLPDTTSNARSLAAEGLPFLAHETMVKVSTPFIHRENLNYRRFFFRKTNNNYDNLGSSHRNGFKTGNSSERLAPKFLSSQFCYTATSDFFS